MRDLRKASDPSHSLTWCARVPSSNRAACVRLAPSALT